jgi:hypothetical protein
VLTPERLGQWLRAVAARTFPVERGRQARLIALLQLPQPTVSEVIGRKGQWTPEFGTLVKLTERMQCADVDALLRRVRHDLALLDVGDQVPSLLNKDGELHCQPPDGAGQIPTDRGGHSTDFPLTLRAETGHSASTHKTDEVVDASASLRSLSTTERRQLFLFQQRIGMGLVLTAQRELQELARLDRARNTTRTRESDRKISSPRKEQPRRSKDGSRGR